MANTRSLASVSGASGTQQTPSGKLLDLLPGRCNGQAGLAHPTGTEDRDQPRCRVCQQLRQLGKFFVSADKRRGQGRKIVPCPPAVKCDIRLLGDDGRRL